MVVVGGYCAPTRQGSPCCFRAFDERDFTGKAQVMRRRTATIFLFAVTFVMLSVSGCSSSGGSDSTVARTTSPPKTVLDLGKIPNADGIVTTAVATTSAPAVSTSAVPSTVPSTVAVSLPPGVTEADRRAAEAAAIDWWEMFYDQLVALPNFDRNEVLRRSAPGTPGGPAVLETLEERRRNLFRFVVAEAKQIGVERSVFVDAQNVSVEVCASDDGYFVQEKTGKKEDVGMASSFYTTLLRRVADRWLVIDFGSNRQTVPGRICAE